MKVILIGFMSSGKTTIGQKIAEKNKLPFYDLDRLIEETIDMTIPHYFSQHSEEEFRKLESQVLSTTIKNRAGILSTGGGTISNPDNFKLLKNCEEQIIFLDISDQAIKERLENDLSRPLVKKLGIDGLIKLKHSRNQDYESLSDFKIMTDNFSINGTLNEIEQKLRS